MFLAVHCSATTKLVVAHSDGPEFGCLFAYFVWSHPQPPNKEVPLRGADIEKRPRVVCYDVVLVGTDGNDDLKRLMISRTFDKALRDANRGRACF